MDEKKQQDENQQKQDDKKKEIKIETEEDLIDALNTLLDESDKEPDVIIKTDRIKGITIKSFKNLGIDYLFNLIMNMALIIALSGWFKVIYFDKIYILIIFAFLFGNIDYWVKYLIYKINPMLFFKSLGYVFTLSSTIIMAALGTIGYIFFDMELSGAWLIVGCYFLFLVVRALLITYIRKIF